MGVGVGVGMGVGVGGGVGVGTGVGVVTGMTVGVIVSFVVMIFVGVAFSDTADATEDDIACALNCTMIIPTQRHNNVPVTTTALKCFWIWFFILFYLHLSASHRYILPYIQMRRCGNTFFTRMQGSINKYSVSE
jgi:glycerol-3-phosphate acyltransferase PlsY